MIDRCVIITNYLENGKSKVIEFPITYEDWLKAKESIGLKADDPMYRIELNGWNWCGYDTYDFYDMRQSGLSKEQQIIEVDKELSALEDYQLDDLASMEYSGYDFGDKLDAVKTGDYTLYAVSTPEALGKAFWNDNGYGVGIPIDHVVNKFIDYAKFGQSLIDNESFFECRGGYVYIH